METENLSVTVDKPSTHEWVLRARRRLTRKVPLDTLLMKVTYVGGLVNLEGSTGLAAVTKADLGPFGGPLMLGAVTGGIRMLRHGGAASGRLGLLAGVAVAGGTALVTSMNRQDLLTRCMTVAEYYAYSPEVGSGQEEVAVEG